MKRLLAIVWAETLSTIFPHPARITTEERAANAGQERAEAINIGEIKAGKHAAALLDVARSVLADEDARKSGAEARATAFLAAMATLIPLLTWAVGTASPVCSAGLGCTAWSIVFILAVIYLMTAGYWSLRTLAVGNYHCLGVEEVRRYAFDRNFELAIAKELLINARLNRETINRKLACIKCAQRCSYQALFLLAALLISDPIARFHILPGVGLTSPAPAAVAPSTLPASAQRPAAVPIPEPAMSVPSAGLPRQSTPILSPSAPDPSKVQPPAATKP